MNGYIFTLFIVFGTMFWISSMARTRVAGMDRRYNEEETEIVQELHRGLERMGARIDALETILLDQAEYRRTSPPPVPPRESVGRF